MDNILMDPKMFHLGEDEIRVNLDFFRQVIELSSSGDITVCLYKEIIDSIVNRQIHPFPIDISQMKDPELRQEILILNDAFIKSIMKNFKEIDIDNCLGNQEFCIESKARDRWEEQDDYYAFFSMLLIPCYKSISLNDGILTGQKKVGIQTGEAVTISCNCGNKRYAHTYTWMEPVQLMSESQKAFLRLRKLAKETEGWFVENPETIKGKHHNHIQNEDFKCFRELSAKNKRVIALLRYFGLYKIYFENFAEDTACEIGTIKIVDVKAGKDSEIVCGWFYSCLGYRIAVKMYFPCGVGENLMLCTNKEFSRMKIEQLKTELAL